MTTLWFSHAYQPKKTLLFKRRLFWPRCDSPPLNKGFAFFFLLATSPLCAASTLPDRPQGYVTDQANIINEGTHVQLEDLLTRFEKISSAQIAVVTVSSLEGDEINDYGNRLFKKWGIGQKGKDNGVLFLIAPTERKARIEVGYGLEGILTDGLTGQVLDEKVIPFFRAGDNSGGILSGTQELCRVIAAKSNINLDQMAGLEEIPQPQSQPITLKDQIIYFIIIFVVVLVVAKNPWLLFFLLSRGGGGSSGGSSGGGFGGGGFGGFGGGSSGGGGSSRGW